MVVFGLAIGMGVAANPAELNAAFDTARRLFTLICALHITS